MKLRTVLLQSKKMKIVRILKNVIPVVRIKLIECICRSRTNRSQLSRVVVLPVTLRTSSTVTETINVVEYQTGQQYTVTGNNISTDSNSLVPPATSTTQAVNGINSTWTSLDATNMPNFSVTDSSKPWQLTTTLSQPGLKSQTIIQRTTEVTSVTDTVSTFSQ